MIDDSQLAINISGVRLRAIDANDLPIVTKIHGAAFPDSALTKLGHEAVRRYYEWQLVGPHQIIAIGCDDDGRLVGFCFAGVFYGAMSGFLNKNKRYLTRHILTHPWLMANPLIRERGMMSIKLIRRTRQKLIKTSSPSAQWTVSFGVLAIAVNPENQSVGLGRMMMDAVEEYARQDGHKKIGLSVATSNTKAIQFYEKQGWQKVMTQGVWTGRMAKEII